ncbi:glycoside hydrolase family 2 protein [Cohnella silvisoli]|uniref:beta-mannosidase n=1 Tax=Cohnella silvisoli TaxID=2873699 RepID=A0ABV1KMI1_9BACL|nr:glycoside hydrolase family 2 TIM barrel-domain containing protein [Cohnella silvisoli]MCD9020374.1 hypothetical protein [Cohnella silvisoli]
MSIRKIKLDEWDLKGFYPFVPLLGKSLETGGELLGVTDWIPATVPGSVQHDLLQAGIIEDPYYGTNSLSCEWVANRWWIYRTKFDFNRQEGETVRLCFQGLDYKAHIYLNQSLLHTHEGMFQPLALDVTDLLRTENNELMVMFEHAPDEMGQIGYTSKTSTQKSRFAYKWDFSARLVPIGFWDEVYIGVTGRVNLKETRLEPEWNGEDRGVIRVKSLVACGSEGIGEFPRAISYRVAIYKDGNRVSETGQKYVVVAEQTVCEAELKIENPEFWYPNGMGDQPVYEVHVEIWDGEHKADQWEGATGFRSLAWVRNEGEPHDSLPYTIVVNGEKMYIKGVNLTPLDILYGNVSDDQYRRTVTMLKEAHINLVRVWGGGLIEKEIFYDLCDRSGILIWQEFIQSSSGIDNVPSKDPHFLRLLEETAVSALKTKRNHISLACWSGGNELTDHDGVPVTAEDDNIALLKSLVDTYDPGRFFLPSSASGPLEFLDVEQPGKNHDVHGPWKYGGPEKHYELYNRSDSLLHSEFGVDGCCSVSSMRRFLPDEHLKVTSVQDNLVWRHHGEWWDTLERSRQFFGELPNLESLAAASQWVQAEGIRYALEANRRRKYGNSGSIVWQFNEPWPNVSCTSLVDYYGEPKMAYYAVRQAYRPFHLSLKYDKLVFRHGETFKAACYVHNSGKNRSYDWQADCFDLNGNFLWTKRGSHIVGANSASQAAEFSMPIDERCPDVFGIRLRWDADTAQSNVYFFSARRESWFRSLWEGPKPILDCSLKNQTVSAGNGTSTGTFVVRNVGGSVALFVKAKAPPGADAADVRCLQNDSVLLPGESREFEVLTSIRAHQENLSSVLSNVSFQAWNDR